VLLVQLRITQSDLANERATAILATGAPFVWRSLIAA